MTPQGSHVAAVLNARDLADVPGWLARLAAVLAADATLDRETIEDLVARGRPRWGVQSADEAAAYVAFWADLVKRHDTPQLTAAYADVLYLLGGQSRTCEALGVFIESVRRDPSVFIEYAGNFSELPPQCGPAAELDYELAKIAYYAHRVDAGAMDAAELQDAVRGVLAGHGGDPGVRARLLEIARSSLGTITV